MKIEITVTCDDAATAIIHNLLQIWDSVCAVNGWDKDHLIQVKQARDFVEKMSMLSVEQLKAQYPDSFANFVKKFWSEEEAIEHATKSGWMFDKHGKIVFHIPDDEMRWTISQLKKWSPRGYKNAFHTYKKMCDDLGLQSDDFDQVAEENGWRYTPYGSKCQAARN